MTLSLATVGGKITAALFNAVVGAVNAGGCSLIKPSSIAGTGVAVTALGKVSFTSATTITINGVFTAAFDQYRIMLDIPNAVTPAVAAFTLTSAGSPDTSANYDTQVVQGAGSATAAVQQSAQTSVPITGSSTVATHTTVVELFRPALAAPTAGTAQMFSTSNPGSGTGMFIQLRGFQHRLASAYDGLQITSGNALTGTLRVYGYNAG